MNVTIQEVEHASDTTRLFVAYVVREPVGVLVADTYLDEVTFVGVHEDCRRRGIATQLLLHAAQELRWIDLFDTGERSPAGDAFARSVGLQRGSSKRKLDAVAMEEHLERMLIEISGRGKVLR